MTNLRARLWASASALALASIIAACDGLRQTEPAGPVDGPNFAQALNEWVDLVNPLTGEPFITIPNPCATDDPTQPAFVTISGKFHVTVSENIDALGNSTAHIHVNSANFKGEGTTALIGGEPTGDDYRGKLSDNTRLRAQRLLTGGFAAQDQTKFLLINKEGGPDAMNDLIVTTRVFVNNGEIQWLDATAECGAIEIED
jgi:hypothetical protein